MTQEISDLIAKIQQEGIAVAEKQAAQIKAEAVLRAEEIAAQAKKQAEKIIEKPASMQRGWKSLPMRL